MNNGRDRRAYREWIRTGMSRLAAAVVPKQESGQSDTEYHKFLLFRGLCMICLLLAGAAMLRSAVTVLPDAITVSSSVNGRQIPIYCVETEKKQVALSFDAAWGNEDTQRILEILRKHDVHATFFMTGGWVEKYPEDVKALLSEGHDLGNHSENHKNMSQLTKEECLEEIQKVHTRVQQLTGYEMFLFRPPYGDYDDKVIGAATEGGYYAIQWDVDSLDWKDYGVDAILRNVLENKHLGNGSIILCHNGAKYTADALDALLKGLKKQGYEIVPVSELIYREDYHMNGEGRQIKN